MARSSLRAPTARDSAGIDAALLVMRLALGILILLHGISKLPPPPTFIAAELAKMNLPSALAYGVYLGEIVGADPAHRRRLDTARRADGDRQHGLRRAARAHR